MIGLATRADAEGLADVLRAVLPERVVTAAGLRYAIETAAAEEHRRMWKAEVDGRIVGRALAGIDLFAPTRTAAFAGIAVDAFSRGRGIGAALWEIVAAHLDAVGARRIVSFGHADDASVRFAERCGFRSQGLSRTSAVDPRTLPPPDPPSGAVKIVPLSRFEDDPAGVFAADHESARDEPGPSDYSGMSYETWRRTIWNHPDCDHELGVAAVESGRVVGVSFLHADRATGRAANAGTGSCAPTGDAGSGC